MTDRNGASAWSRIYMTNSLKKNGLTMGPLELTTLASLGNSKSRFRVVALGKSALDRLLSMKKQIPSNMMLELLPDLDSWRRMDDAERNYFTEKLSEYIYFPMTWTSR